MPEVVKMHMFNARFPIVEDKIDLENQSLISNSLAMRQIGIGLRTFTIKSCLIQPGHIAQKKIDIILGFMY
jgi:hypothetical protein